LNPLVKEKGEIGRNRHKRKNVIGIDVEELKVVGLRLEAEYMASNGDQRLNILNTVKPRLMWKKEISLQEMCGVLRCILL
jgi:hypothetical protein